MTENDFAEDSTLRAHLDEGVVVTFLESPLSEASENDTGTLGEDDIPVTYDTTTEQTFCWEDDDASAMHFLQLTDRDGGVILTVRANRDCVTGVIERGDYVISIHHDGSDGDLLPIFLIPDGGASGQARKADGTIDRITLAVVDALKHFEGAVTTAAFGQTVDVTISTLLRTRSCVGCNLEGADLFDRRLGGANLSNANLSGAGLRGAILRGANLRSANLSGANLRFARLNGANLTESDLRRANCGSAIFSDASLARANMTGTRLTDARMANVDLSGADLGVADMSNANLSGANLAGADLRNARLSGANLAGADLSGADVRYVNLKGADLMGAIVATADFNFATWCDGICRCLQQSIGICVGCAPIDICTSL